MFDTIEAGEEEAVKFFNKWTEEVKKTVPKERLLVFEAKQGWKPLCDFLDLPIPDGPFPNVNESAAMSRVIRNSERLSQIFMYGIVPCILASIVYVIFNSYL